jgi:hypothetical protein
MESLDGVTTVELAAIAQVHLSTARRWKRTGKCPRWLERLVRVCHHGELDHIHRAWAGWRLERGQLISPEGWQSTPGAVRSIPLMQAQVKTYQRERRYIAQADWVNQRYAVPAPVDGSGGG